MYVLSTNNYSKIFERKPELGFKQLTQSSLRDELDHLLAYHYHNRKYENDKLIVYFDVETNGLDFHQADVITISFNIENCFICIESPSYFLEEVRFLFSLGDIYVAHNAVFDYNMIRRFLENFDQEKLRCTMIQEKVLNLGSRESHYSLKEVYELTLPSSNLKLDKTITTSFLKYNGSLTLKQLLYIKEDIEVLPAIYLTQRLKGLANQFVTVDSTNPDKVMDLENKMIGVLADMTYYGLTLDKEMWLELANKNIKELDEKKQKVIDWLKDNLPQVYNQYASSNLFGNTDFLLNFDSQKQMLPIFEMLGITLLNEEGNPTLDAKLLGSLHGSHPFVKLFIDYKQTAIKVSTFGKTWLEEFIHPITGRIHSQFNPMLITGRIGSSNPNVQNIPSSEDYRNCFRPIEDDRVAVGGDYSGQEAKILAELSEDKEMIAFYNDKKHGGDQHSFVASLMFNVYVPPKIEDDEEAMKIFNESPYKKLRNKAKSLNFKLAYGGTAYSLKLDLNCSLEEAEELIRQYFDAFKGTANYISFRKKDVFDKGYILVNNISGRKVFIKDFEKFKELKLKGINNKDIGNIERSSINTPIQGTAADMTKTALVLLSKRIKEKYNIKPNEKYPSVYIMLQIYDEILINTKKEFSEEVKVMLEDAMDEAARIFVPSINMRPVAYINKSWKK